MKKNILLLFLLFTCLGFSNPIFDNLVGPRWTCTNLAERQLIFLFVSKNSQNKYSASFNLFNNLSKDESNGYANEFELAINEKEQYFYFANLKKDAKKFTNYKFPYTAKKK